MIYNYIVFDDYKGKQLYLLNAYDDAFIGFADLPTREYTIKEYCDWERKCTENVICITKSHFPKTIPNNAINNFFAIKDAIKIGMEKYNLNEDNVLRPFFSGIHGEDFRDLLMLLFNETKKFNKEKKKPSFFTLRELIIKYYDNLLFDIAKSIKKDVKKQ